MTDVGDLEAVMGELRRDGIAMLPWRLQDDRMVRLWQHLWNAPTWNAHVRAKSTEGPLEVSAALNERRWPMACHDMADVVRAPYLFEAAVMLLPFAAAYFGEPARLYSMNAFWTQPTSGAPYLDTHAWHRDGDDRKQLVLFTLGTNIEKPIHGAHLYQRGTHLVADEDLGRDFRQPPDGSVKVITGLPGTMFICDTRGLHMGVRPNRVRMLAWARFGVSDRPVSYDQDKLEPVELLPNQRAILRDDAMRRAVELVGH